MKHTLTNRVNSSSSLSSGQMVNGSNKASRKVAFRNSSFIQFKEMLCHFGSLFFSASFPSSLASDALKLYPERTCLHISFHRESVLFGFEGPGYSTD